MDFTLGAILIILTILLLISIYLPYHFCPSKSKKLINKIPGYKTVPVFGNLLSFFVSHHQILSKIGEFYQKSDDVFRLWFLGLPFVFFKKLNHIEIIMSSSSFTSKSLDYELLFPWLGTGLVTASGAKWFKHRKILTPAFHFKILDDYLPSFNYNGRILVNKLKNHTEKIVDIKQFITLCTLDIICETSMGTSVNAQTSKNKIPYVEATLRMSKLFQKRQFSFWLHNPLAFSLSLTGLEQKKVLKTLHGFTEKVIKERRIEYRENRHAHSDPNVPVKKRKLNFLDLMIEIVENEGILSNEEIREEVDTFMFEGHDTTASALTWACYSLGRNPEIQEAAYQELEDIFQGVDRDPTSKDLSEMKLLERIFKETLRLYPSVPMFSRSIDKEVTIDGYVLPPKTMLPILPFWIHRDPSIYENPLKFDPDRFLPENTAKRHPFAYLPFSAGPRNCIGQKFAMMEEKVLLSLILRNFKIESLDKEEDIKMMSEIILRPKDPLRIILTPRNK